VGVLLLLAFRVVLVLILLRLILRIVANVVRGYRGEPRVVRDMGTLRRG
jgi:hypothetical protein